MQKVQGVHQTLIITFSPYTLMIKLFNLGVDMTYKTLNADCGKMNVAASNKMQWQQELREVAAHSHKGKMHKSLRISGQQRRHARGYNNRPVKPGLFFSESVLRFPPPPSPQDCCICPAVVQDRRAGGLLVNNAET